MPNDLEKEAAARASLRFIKDGQVVGLGTGSTAAFFIRLLADRVKAGLHVRGIPTSERSGALAASLGIPLVTLEQCPEIDVTVDGADEFDPQLRLIKGGGGALLREKIVASASKQMVVVTDASKRVPVLGKFPLPVEVIKFARPVVARKIADLGTEVRLRLQDNGQPYVTDEGNHILDCHFGQIRDADSVACQLSKIPGIVEHGLFIGIATVILIANGENVEELRR